MTADERKTMEDKVWGIIQQLSRDEQECMYETLYHMGHRIGHTVALVQRPEDRRPVETEFRDTGHVKFKPLPGTAIEYEDAVERDRGSLIAERVKWYQTGLKLPSTGELLPDARFKEHDIKRFVLGSGDTLVIKFDERVSAEIVSRQTERLGKLFPGHRVIGLSAGTDIEIITERGEKAKLWTCPDCNRSIAIRKR